MRDKQQNRKKTESFIGLSKEEIVELLGHATNFDSDREWLYFFKKYWWERPKKLYIEFDQKNRVISQIYNPLI